MDGMFICPSIYSFFFCRGKNIARFTVSIVLQALLYRLKKLLFAMLISIYRSLLRFILVYFPLLQLREECDLPKRRFINSMWGTRSARLIIFLDPIAFYRPILRLVTTKKETWSAEEEVHRQPVGNAVCQAGIFGTCMKQRIENCQTVQLDYTSAQKRR